MKRGLRKINYSNKKVYKERKRGKYMILNGRLSEYQVKEIEKIFWDKDYNKNTEVIRDLVKIGLKNLNEFDKTEIDSPLEKSVRYLSFDGKTENKIKEIRKEKKIKDNIVIIRTLIEIGLKHKDELPNRTPNSSA